MKLPPCMQSCPMHTLTADSIALSQVGIEMHLTGLLNVQAGGHQCLLEDHGRLVVGLFQGPLILKFHEEGVCKGCLGTRQRYLCNAT